MNYFNGSISYESGIVKMYPGRNNDLDNSGGGTSRKLIMKFWMFVDTVDFTNPTQLVDHFEDINTKLHQSLNYYIYQADFLSYSIDVHVVDIDRV